MNYTRLDVFEKDRWMTSSSNSIPLLTTTTMGTTLDYFQGLSNNDLGSNMTLGKEKLISLSQQSQALQLNIVAATALLLWDIILTFDREMRYIWRSKPSLIVSFFFLIRFFAVGGQIVFLVIDLSAFKVNEPFCHGYAWFQEFFALVMFLCVDFLLMSRVFAFYRRSKLVLTILVILDILNITSVVALLGIAVPKFEIISNPDPGRLMLGLCVPLHYPNIQPDVWLPILAFQTVLFVMVIGRHIYLQKREGLTFGVRTTTHVYHIFIRDGVWVFFVVLLDLLFCAIGNSTQIVMGPIALQWCYTVIGISCTRIILNLRTAADEPPQLILYHPSTPVDRIADTKMPTLAVDVTVTVDIIDDHMTETNIHQLQ